MLDLSLLLMLLMERMLSGKIFGSEYKVRCVFLMIGVSILLHAEIGRNDHREDALHFI